MDLRDDLHNLTKDRDVFGLGVGASESIDGDHERLEHAVFDERRLRGGVRRQRDSLQQQTEIAFGHGLRPVR